MFFRVFQKRYLHTVEGFDSDQNSPPDSNKKLKLCDSVSDDLNDPFMLNESGNLIFGPFGISVEQSQIMLRSW